jgi:hypothetical protein
MFLEKTFCQSVLKSAGAFLAQIQRSILRPREKSIRGCGFCVKTLCFTGKKAHSRPGKNQITVIFSQLEERFSGKLTHSKITQILEVAICLTTNVAESLS